MDLQKEREAFEAYMAEKYKNLVDRRQCRNNGGGYMAWDMNVAWRVWQAAKAQAVPEGFVVVNQKDLLELTIAINAVDLATHTESKTNEVREMWQQVALKLMALGTAQEPSDD